MGRQPAVAAATGTERCLRTGNGLSRPQKWGQAERAREDRVSTRGTLLCGGQRDTAYGGGGTFCGKKVDESGPGLFLERELSKLLKKKKRFSLSRQPACRQLRARGGFTMKASYGLALSCLRSMDRLRVSRLPRGASTKVAAFSGQTGPMTAVAAL